MAAVRTRQLTRVASTCARSPLTPHHSVHARLLPRFAMWWCCSLADSRPPCSLLPAACLFVLLFPCHPVRRHLFRPHAPVSFLQIRCAGRGPHVAGPGHPRRRGRVCQRLRRRLHCRLPYRVYNWLRPRLLWLTRDPFLAGCKTWDRGRALVGLALALGRGVCVAGLEVGPVAPRNGVLHFCARWHASGLTALSPSLRGCSRRGHSGE